MDNELKQVIIVRSDIKMGKGKIASQVAHASVSSFYEVLQKNKEMAERWIKEGQKKVVLKRYRQSKGNDRTTVKISRTFQEVRNRSS